MKPMTPGLPVKYSTVLMQACGIVERQIEHRLDARLLREDALA